MWGVCACEAAQSWAWKGSLASGVRRVGAVGGGVCALFLNYLKNLKVDRCKMRSCGRSEGGCCKVFCCMLMLLSNA